MNLPKDGGIEWLYTGEAQQEPAIAWMSNIIASYNVELPSKVQPATRIVTHIANQTCPGVESIPNIKASLDI